MNRSTAIENSWEFQLPNNMRYQAFQHQNVFLEIYEHDCLDFETFDFYFRSALCNDVEDKEFVWVIGTELASLFNGASIIASAEPEVLTVLNLYGDGKKIGKFHFRPKHLEPKEEMDLAEIFGDSASTEPVKAVESALSFEPARIREILRSQASTYVDVEAQKGLQWQTRLILDCVSNDTTYDLLKYFDYEFSWTSLYKIYEALEHEYRTNARKKGLELKVFEKGCTQKERFKFSANKYQVSGVEGRHARDEAALFSKQPLGLAESIELWRETAKEYLK